MEALVQAEWSNIVGLRLLAWDGNEKIIHLMLLLKNTVFVLSLNVILLNSEYSQAYFYCLNTSAENLSSNLFLILISMLFKKKKKNSQEFHS